MPACVAAMRAGSSRCPPVFLSGNGTSSAHALHSHTAVDGVPLGRSLGVCTVCLVAKRKTFLYSASDLLAPILLCPSSP